MYSKIRNIKVVDLQHLYYLYIIHLCTHLSIECHMRVSLCLKTINRIENKIEKIIPINRSKSTKSFIPFSFKSYPELLETHPYVC